MPWYSVADIQIAERDGTVALPFTYQVRPGLPVFLEPAPGRGSVAHQADRPDQGVGDVARRRGRRLLAQPHRLELAPVVRDRGVLLGLRLHRG